MEDERGAGGLIDSGGVSEPALSGKLADESVAENMGRENRVEKVFEEGDGEEIMVEVVGSDVFVDGVGGNEEGDGEMAEMGELKGGVVGKREEDGDKMDEGDLGSSESRDEKHGVAEVDTSLSMSIGVTEKVSALLVGGVGGVDDEVSNCGINAVDALLKEAIEPPAGVAGVSPMNINGEKENKGKTVDKDASDSVKPDSDEKIDLGEDKEKDDSAAESKDSIPKLDAPTELPDFQEKDVSVTENTDSITNLDAPTDAPNESQSCLDDYHGAEFESNDQSDGVSHAGSKSILENSFDTHKEETVGKIECSKAEDDVEGYKSQNKIITSTPIADGADAVEVDKDNNLNVDVKDDAKENVQNKTSMSGSTDGEIVKSTPGIYSDQPIISSTVGAEMGYQNAVIPSVNDVDGGESGEKGMEIDSVDFGKSLAGHGSLEIPKQDDSAENIPLPSGAHLDVETSIAIVTEDPVPCHDLTSEGIVPVVDESGSSQRTKEVVDLQIMESSSHDADKLEKTEMIPNEVPAVAADSDTTQVSIMPEGNGSIKPLLPSTDVSLLDGVGNENFDEVWKSREADEVPRESNGFYDAETLEGHTFEAKPMEVEEETERPSSESDKLKMSNEERVKYSGSLRMKQSGYLTPPENEGCFTPSDLVWGKVRSHPWWPGQIFDPEDASEKAVKHHKKDSYLVAYFGDQTFAWNDSSALKPFRSYFSQIEKQSNSESFHNAVNCALEEVERRIQLGLSCSCIPKDDFAKIETQIVENTGIREESSQRCGVDQSSSASHFEPNELLEFIRNVAPCASSGADRLDLVIARAQLSAFCSFNGYRSPIEFPSSGELLENDEDTEHISDEAVVSDKRQCILKGGAESRKERSLMELMGDGEYSLDDEDNSVDGNLGKSVSLSTGKKRKALDSLAEGSDKRASGSAAKLPAPASQAPKPSFKIGDCIRRVANKLTGSTSLVKGNNDEMPVNGSQRVQEPSEKQSMVVSAESLSVSDMLSQLELLAQDPKKRHYAQHPNRAFFMGFRSSIALSRRGRKKQSEQAVGESGEEFEFDDVNDSYWTDRIVQNYSAEKLLHERMNADGSLPLVPFDAEKSRAGRKPHSRKRFSTGNSPTSASDFDEIAKRIKQESSPAELILSFQERNRIPSEINLNKMFRRFGPLMESETEIDHESGSAKVIFKRGSDADVARNSAEKFSIFGPVVVSYQIGYAPVISVKILPVTLPQSQEDASLML